MSDQLSPRTRRRPTFYAGMSWALMLIVFIGFARTFYLRAYFPVPDVPMSLLIHGGFLTAWYLWLCSQTSLVLASRTDLHRRLGWIGVLLGVAVLVTGVIATLGFVPRFIATGRDYESHLPRLAVVVWGNFAWLLAFTVFLTLAVLFRHRSDFHKRLMIFASVSIIGPAIMRVVLLPGWFGMDSLPKLPFPIIATAMFVIALVAHDLATTRRIHRVTLAGTGFLAALDVLEFVVSTSEFGRAFIFRLA